MPQLNWNEYEFIECLEVLPDVEDGVRHEFVVQRAGLKLLVTVWQLESIVQLLLRQTDQELPLIDLALVVRDKVRHLKGPDATECLDFLDVLLAPSRFSYVDCPRRNWFNPAELPGIASVRLFVKPAIRIELLRQAGSL